MHIHDGNTRDFILDLKVKAHGVCCLFVYAKFEFNLHLFLQIKMKCDNARKGGLEVNILVVGLE